MLSSRILIVEDDKDDCDLLAHALQEAGIRNEFLCFQNPAEALNYLKTTAYDTHLIISDINMPMMNGLDFKKKINEDVKLKSKTIPFVFLSTSASSQMINDAYKLCIQGYFQKPNSVSTLNDVVRSIVDYWNTSRHPLK